MSGASEKESRRHPQPFPGESRGPAARKKDWAPASAGELRFQSDAAERGFKSLVGVPHENGFTLIEMLVALAIFSLAALALLRLGGATAANSARLNDQALASMVARNLAVETLTDPQPPAFGTSAGEAVNGGRRWRWTRNVGRSPEARIQQIEIGVEAEAGGPGRAHLTLFRRGPV